MEQPASNKFQLFAVIVFAVVGALAIFAGRLRSAMVREMSVTGVPGRIVGALYIIMAGMLFADWLKRLGICDRASPRAGQYSAIVSGAGGTTGVALVEVYALN